MAKANEVDDPKNCRLVRARAEAYRGPQELKQLLDRNARNSL